MIETKKNDKFNDEDFFQVGFNSISSDPKMLTEIVSNGWVSGNSINFDFFCQMVERGREIALKRTKK